MMGTFICGIGWGISDAGGVAFCAGAFDAMSRAFHVSLHCRRTGVQIFEDQCFADARTPF